MAHFFYRTPVISMQDQDPKNHRHAICFAFASGSRVLGSIGAKGCWIGHLVCMNRVQGCRMVSLCTPKGARGLS